MNTNFRIGSMVLGSEYIILVKTTRPFDARSVELRKTYKLYSHDNKLMEDSPMSICKVPVVTAKLKKFYNNGKKRYKPTGVHAVISCCKHVERLPKGPNWIRLGTKRNKCVRRLRAVTVEQHINAEQKSTFTFEDAMSMVSAEHVYA